MSLGGSWDAMGRERTGFLEGFEGRPLAAAARFFHPPGLVLLRGVFRIGFFGPGFLVADRYLGEIVFFAFLAFLAFFAFFAGLEAGFFLVAFFTDLETDFADFERAVVFLRAGLPRAACDFFFSLFLLLLAIRLQHRFPAALRRPFSTEIHSETGRARPVATPTRVRSQRSRIGFSHSIAYRARCSGFAESTLRASRRMMSISLMKFTRCH